MPRFLPIAPLLLALAGCGESTPRPVASTPSAEKDDPRADRPVTKPTPIPMH